MLLGLEGQGPGVCLEEGAEMILGELQREYLARENTIPSLDMKPVQRMRVKNRSWAEKAEASSPLN